MNKNEKFWKDAWAGNINPKSSNHFAMEGARHIAWNSDTPPTEEQLGVLKKMIDVALESPIIMGDITKRIAEDTIKNMEKIIKESLIKKGYDDKTKVYVKKEEGNDWTYYFADEEGTVFICQIKEKYSFEGNKANMDLVYHNGPMPTNHLNF